MKRVVRCHETFYETGLRKVYVWKRTYRKNETWNLVCKLVDPSFVLDDKSAILEWLNVAFLQRSETTIDSIEDELDVTCEFDVDVTRSQGARYNQLVVDGAPQGEVIVETRLGMVKAYRQYKETLAQQFFTSRCDDFTFKNLDAKRRKLGLSWCVTRELLEGDTVDRYLDILDLQLYIFGF